VIWLRVILAIAVLLQAASSGLPLLAFAAYRFGLIHPTSGPAATMAPLWRATPDWQLAVWLLAILILLAAALRLVLRRSALLLYVVAIVVNFGLQQLMQRSDAYREVFGTNTPGFDYARLAILVLVGALIWWVEQQRGKAAPAKIPAADSSG
jgi:hypothetical protein